MKNVAKESYDVSLLALGVNSMQGFVFRWGDSEGVSRGEVGGWVDGVDYNAE